MSFFMGLLRELGLSSAAGRGACSLRVVEYDYAPASTRSRHIVPSPACGGGTGRGHIRRFVPPHPLPNPPPQAGEGVDRVRGAISARAAGAGAQSAIAPGTEPADARPFSPSKEDRA